MTRLTRRSLIVAGAAVAAVLVVEARARAAAAPGQVTFLVGEATRSAQGKTEKLANHAQVFENDVIETHGRTRLEIRLPDKSVIRVGPESKVVLASAVFGKTVEDRKVSAKLLVGNVWAKVAHAVGGDAKFEVQTDNAVAGVRGTTFRVDANKDRSCVVKVYGGTVAVAAGPVPRPEHKGGAGGKKERHPIAGPQQVTREQWEKKVTAMMQIRVAADGTPGDPEQFALSEGEDEWEAWNRERDAAEEKGG
jgi:hypothetical protein